MRPYRRQWRDTDGIAVVPLTVRFGEETFVDRVELEAPAFWRKFGGR